MLVKTLRLTVTLSLKFSNLPIKGKAASHTYCKLDIVSVVLRSDERRTLITSAHIIKCLAHTEFQNRGQLVTAAGGYRVWSGVIEFI